MTRQRADKGTSRRQFFKMLAGSPLLALAYPGLPPSWQQEVGRELERGAAAGPRPAGIPCPDCGQEMVFTSPADLSRYSQQASGAPNQGAGALETHLEGQLIESAELGAPLVCGE